MSVHIPINILLLLGWSPGPLRPKLIFFWPCLVACRISVSQPGIEPRPQQWKHQILTTRPPGNSKNSSLKWVLVQKKNQPLGKPRTVSQVAPTCSPPCGHSAGNSPLHGSGSRQSDRGLHTPDNSRGTCGRGSAGGHRNCTGWAAASGTPGKSRKEQQESSSRRSHRPVALQSELSGFPRTWVRMTSSPNHSLFQLSWDTSEIPRPHQVLTLTPKRALPLTLLIKNRPDHIFPKISPTCRTVSTSLLWLSRGPRFPFQRPKALLEF